MPTTAVVALLSSAAVAAAAASPSDWPVFGHDAARTSHTTDTAISKADVGRLRERWVAKFAANADSTPVYAAGVTMRDGRRHDVLFQTATDGTTYAVDADLGTIDWTFETHGPNVTTSTPAIDPSHKWIYAPGVDGFVHKLAIATGAEVRDRGFPVRLTWKPEVEKDAAALNLSGGFLYAVTSGYNGDFGDYDGHVVAVDIADGKTRVFNSLCGNIVTLLGHGQDCDERQSGIWARSGAVVDPDPAMHGRIYVATGNGLFDIGRHDFGDSVLAIAADGSALVDFFTPIGYATLQAFDTDLGSTAPAMLPRDPKSRTPLMAVQGGKDGILRLLDRRRLGGVGGEIQDFDLGTAVFTAPAVWRDAAQTTWVCVGTTDSVTAFTIATGPRGKSELRKAWTSRVGGSSPVEAGGIVFVASNGELDVLDARTGSELWSSTSASAGGTIGDIHWESPIVVGRWVYISDQSGDLFAYEVKA